MLTSKFDLYKREWLDLVFNDRNKNYGAYDLRAHASTYMVRAMAVTLFTFAGGAVLLNVLQKPQDQTVYIEHKIDVTRYVKPPVTLPKKEEIHEAKINHAKPAAKPVIHVAVQASPIPKPTMDPVKEDKFTPQDKIINPGQVTTPGDGQLQTTVIDSQQGTDKGTLGGKGTPDDNTPYIGVDVMPEPTGGLAAWAKFLKKSIRYPDTDSEGKVYLSFIVEKDGHLSNITLVKGVSTLLDEEAMRVLKIAPNWKPGQQNGQAVRVKYTLPISFQLNQ